MHNKNQKQIFKSSVNSSINSDIQNNINTTNQ